MDDYISRKAALKVIYTSTAPALEVKAMPAADVVEVVRCRDCENWDTDWMPSQAGKGQYFCPILGQVTDTDFYCGCGERKDGGQDDE